MFGRFVHVRSIKLLDWTTSWRQWEKKKTFSIPIQNERHCGTNKHIRLVLRAYKRSHWLNFTSSTNFTFSERTLFTNTNTQTIYSIMMKRREHKLKAQSVRRHWTNTELDYSSTNNRRIQQTWEKKHTRSCVNLWNCEWQWQ